MFVCPVCTAPIQFGSFAAIRKHLRKNKSYGRLNYPIVCIQDECCNIELSTVSNYIRHLKLQHNFDLPADNMPIEKHDIY